jgi:hypothetical protein
MCTGYFEISLLSRRLKSASVLGLYLAKMSAQRVSTRFNFLQLPRLPTC